MDHIDQNLGIHPVCWEILGRLSRLEFAGTKSKFNRVTFDTRPDAAIPGRICIRVEIVNGPKRYMSVSFGKAKGKHCEILEFHVNGWNGKESFALPVSEVLISMPGAAIRKIQVMIEDFIASTIVESVMEV